MQESKKIDFIPVSTMLRYADRVYKLVTKEKTKNVDKLAMAVILFRFGIFSVRDLQKIVRLTDNSIELFRLPEFLNNHYYIPYRQPIQPDGIYLLAILREQLEKGEPILRSHLKTLKTVYGMNYTTIGRFLGVDGHLLRIAVSRADEINSKYYPVKSRVRSLKEIQDAIELKKQDAYHARRVFNPESKSSRKAAEFWKKVAWRLGEDS